MRTKVVKPKVGKAKVRGMTAWESRVGEKMKEFVLKLQKLTSLGIRMNCRKIELQAAWRAQLEFHKHRPRGRRNDPDWSRDQDLNWNSGRRLPPKQVTRQQGKWDFLRKYFSKWNSILTKMEKEASRQVSKAVPKEARRQVSKAVPKDHGPRQLKPDNAKEAKKKASRDRDPSPQDSDGGSSSSSDTLFTMVLVHVPRRRLKNPKGSNRTPPEASSDLPIASTSAQALARERAEECLHRKRDKKGKHFGPCRLEDDLNSSGKVESWLFGEKSDSQWENDLMNSEEAGLVFAEALGDDYFPDFDLFEEEALGLAIPTGDLNLQTQSPDMKLMEVEVPSPSSGPSRPAVEVKDDDEDDFDADVLVINADDDDFGLME